MSLIIKNREQIFKGKFIKVWGTHFLDNDGNEQLWEWVEKKDAAVIFPITKDNKIILIKNYRVAIEKYVIELPAGLLDKKGESARDAAARELIEETGYEAGEMIALPPTPFAPGTMSMISNYFIATGATKVSEAHGEATEDITVLEIPANELVDFYLNNPDQLFHMSILGVYQVALAKGLIT